MKQSTNFGMNLPEGNNVVDIDVLNANITNSIDKGLTLDVGDSTGTGNNYILNIGSITLSTNNKGIAFRFWADKDSNGAVKINTNYNLLKGVGKPVSNLKAGNPYTIVYDGGTNFFLGSGSSVDSDKVTATERDVLINKTFIGTDEEIHTGTMPELGDVTKTLGINETFTLGEGHINSLNVNQNIPLMNPNWNDVWETNQYTVGTHMYNNGLNYALLKVPNGHYINGVNWVSAYAPDLKPENIVAGKNILGVNGSGRRVASGTLTPSSGRALSFDQIGFVPSVFIIHQQTQYRKKVNHITCVLTKRALELSGQDYIQAQLVHSWFDSKGDEQSTCSAIVSWYSDGYYIDTTESQPYDWWAIQ